MSLSNKKNKIKMVPEDRIYHAIVIPIFILFTILCIYPFWYLMICTVSDSKQIDMGNVILWPIGFHFDNYVRVFKEPGLGRAAFISIARVFCATAATVLCCAYGGYFLTKQNWWGRKFWYRFMVYTMYFSAGLIPGYLNYRDLGLLNTFWMYVIPGCFSIYNAVLVKTNIEAMPKELEESAVLDGAGYMRRFVQIVLPLQKPILATIALWTAVGAWNDFMTTKIYITKPSLSTLQFKLNEILLQTQAAAEAMKQAGMQMQNVVTPTGVRLALTAVIVIPIMCVYPFIQKYYVKGVMIGAVKG